MAAIAVSLGSAFQLSHGSRVAVLDSGRGVHGMAGLALLAAAADICAGHFCAPQRHPHRRAAGARQLGQSLERSPLKSSPTRVHLKIEKFARQSGLGSSTPSQHSMF